MSQFFAPGCQSSGVSASASVLLMNILDWSPLGLTNLITLQYKGLLRVFSNIMVQKHQFFGAKLSLRSKSNIHTWLLEKPQLWLDGPFFGKVMSLLFNILSRLVIRNGNPVSKQVCWATLANLSKSRSRPVEPPICSLLVRNPGTNWNLVQEYKKSASSIFTATNLVVVDYKSDHNLLQIYPLTTEEQFAAVVLVAKLSPTLAPPWTVTHQVPFSMGFPGKNTGVGCHFLLQGIFPILSSNAQLLNWQVDFLPTEPPGKPEYSYLHRESGLACDLLRTTEYADDTTLWQKVKKT